MAAIARPFSETTFFAPQYSQRFASLATTQCGDVIARREQRLTAITMAEPRRIPVRIAVAGEYVEFTYSTFGTGLPPWAGPVFESLAERWGARPGWDSYRAKPTSPSLVVKLLNVLFNVMEGEDPPPQITPLEDGGVQAEWHNHGLDLEITVPADEDATYYYFNRLTEEEEESNVSDRDDRVQALIRRLK
jgi:hypothetical protein